MTKQRFNAYLKKAGWVPGLIGQGGNAKGQIKLADGRLVIAYSRCFVEVAEARELIRERYLRVGSKLSDGS